LAGARTVTDPGTVTAEVTRPAYDP